MITKSALARLDARKSKVILEDGGKISDLATIIARTVIQHEATKALFENGTKRHQCGPNRSRSVEDVYLVAKTYLPGITYGQVDLAMDTLVKKHKLTRHFCNMVRRNVHGSGVPSIRAIGVITQVLNENKVNVTRSNNDHTGHRKGNK